MLALCQMTFNELVSKIALQEGKKDQETIGNVREALKIVLTELANMPAGELGKLLRACLTIN